MGLAVPGVGGRHWELFDRRVERWWVLLCRGGREALGAI